MFLGNRSVDLREFSFELYHALPAIGCHCRPASQKRATLLADISAFTRGKWSADGSG
jgi:hypothetical protein